LYGFLASPICTTCPSHLILLPMTVTVWSKVHMALSYLSTDTGFKSLLGVWMYVHIFLCPTVLCRKTSCQGLNLCPRSPTKCLKDSLFQN
jgi:hypothetical protein